MQYQMFVLKRQRYIRYFVQAPDGEEALKGYSSCQNARMDQDTTRGKLAHDRISPAFAAVRMKFSSVRKWG